MLNPLGSIQKIAPTSLRSLKTRMLRKKIVVAMWHVRYLACATVNHIRACNGYLPGVWLLLVMNSNL